ncbi:ROK family protein, partial [Actinotalea sp.]|uniref:ROK family protein n=1 Tax=Actinotalea sp. TaxID=1872145 RepID=UPI0035677E56
PTSRSGRRAQEVTLARNLGLVAGVQVSERSLRVALADVSQRIVADQRLPLPPAHRADSGLDRVAILVEELAESVGAGLGEILGVGVGVPAPVDSRTGIVSAHPILPGWGGVRVPEVLGRRLGLPVVVDNATNLGALAESRFGVARDADSLVFVRVSHGVSMGLVIGGVVHRGRRGAAGELGHVRDVEDGPACRCGLTGCLEGSIGAAALAARLAPTHGHLALRDVVARALAGDAACTRVVGEAGRRLGRALASVCTVIDPDLLVLDGELVGAGEAFLGPLRRTLEADVLPTDPPGLRVELAALGGDAPLRGALALALDAYEVGVTGPLSVLT